MTVRDDRYDIMKGVAIILMVVGHAECEAHVRSFIYLFHMPLFFIVSGWLYRAGFEWAEARRFVTGRLTRLWWPFVLWCSVFALAHNALLAWHVYPDVAHAAVAVQNQVLYEPWAVNDLIRTLGQIVLLQGGNYLLMAPLWFLQVLFFASMLYYLGDFVLSRFRLTVRVRRIVLLAGSLVVLAVTKYLHIGKLIILEAHLGGAVISTALVLMALGALLRDVNLPTDRLRGWWAGLTALVLAIGLAILSTYGTLELCANEFPSILFLLFSSLAGTVMLFCVASLDGPWRGVLAYVGRHTMAILIFHVCSFRLLDGCSVVVSGGVLDAAGVPEFVLSGACGCWPYVAAGVALPLLVEAVWRRMRGFRI